MTAIVEAGGLARRYGRGTQAVAGVNFTNRKRAEEFLAAAAGMVYIVIRLRRSRDDT